MPTCTLTVAEEPSVSFLAVELRHARDAIHFRGERRELVLDVGPLVGAEGTRRPLHGQLAHPVEDDPDFRRSAFRHRDLQAPSAVLR